MELTMKPDFETSRKRYEAFWEREIIDRPPVSIVLPVEKPKEAPVKEYKTLEEQWIDIDFRAYTETIRMENLIFYADTLPVVIPNMGPEIFSAWCGCGYRFGKDTTWSEPCISDWDEDADKAVFNPTHPLFLLTVEYTKKLMELGKGKFITGLTDFHPGGDHLAALRDPQELALDMFENADLVKEKLHSSLKEYYKVYDIFYHMLRDEGLPITSWTPLVCDGRYYIPSNDFSCMISKEMFDEIFLEGIEEECRFYDRSIYHLDGPGALRHLDSLLEIKELDAIQWVCGAGNEGYAKWVEVYQKIQAAGKGIQLAAISINELPLIFETLHPEGIWFSDIRGINDVYTADKVLKSIESWSL